MKEQDKLGTLQQ